MRPSGRKPDQMRAVTIERHVVQHAEGSCLISFGATRVICTASVETTLPSWRRGQRPMAETSRSFVLAIDPRAAMIQGTLGAHGYTGGHLH